MAVRAYEISLRVLKNVNMSREISYNVSPSSHVILYLLQTPMKINTKSFHKRH